MAATTTPPWPGKKTTGSPVGRWVAAQLPHRRRYIEPFCGMAGVLLGRARSEVEVLNDLDERVVNWWRAVRDNPEGLRRLLDATPEFSRAEYHRAAELCHGEGIMPAYYFTLRMCWSWGGQTESTNIYDRWAKPPPIKSVWPGRVDVGGLADRLRGVVVECLPATELLRRAANLEDAVIYCDPPYPTGDKRLYAHKGQDLDLGALSAALRAQSGAVAVSGYGDEWDEWLPGWERRTRGTRAGIHADDGRRVEVLWLNDQCAAAAGTLF